MAFIFIPNFIDELAITDLGMDVSIERCPINNNLIPDDLTTADKLDIIAFKLSYKSLS